MRCPMPSSPSAGAPRGVRPGRAALLPAALLALLPALAACGTTSDAVDPGTSSTAEAVVVQDATGADVVLEDGPATRVVALEWAQAEMLSSLGTELVGLSDVEGYESWVGGAVPLASEPTDVGLRTEPSVEQIADLEPDLIVGVAESVPDAVREQMEQVAPVLLQAGADASDPLGTATEELRTLATAVGAEEEADEVVAAFETTLEENAQVLADAGLAGTPVTFTSPYAEGANVTVRMHGPGSAPQAVLTAMGLEPAWTEAGDEAYAISSTDVEGLTALPERTWFTWWANGASEDPVETSLSSNAVWQSLPFVEAGRVAGVADGVWVYGGPASLAAFSDEMTALLTSAQAG